MIDHAPEVAPSPMTLRQARSFARELFGASGMAERNGSLCVVGIASHAVPGAIVDRGHGATWEAAFDAALTATGR